jgi:glycosyltransferase involved in cell wall biosynthesis
MGRPAKRLSAADRAPAHALHVVSGPFQEDGSLVDEVVSVIVPVLHDTAALDQPFHAYQAALGAAGHRIEFVYVVHCRALCALGALRRLKEAGEPLTAVVLSRWDGEAAALRVGLQHARGQVIVTLPDHLQVEPTDLPAVLAALDGCDLAVGHRRSGGHGLQSTVFHWLIRSLFGHSFNDLACRVRAYRRRVLEELVGYSMQPHFLPLLASERGFRVREVEVGAGRGRLERPRLLNRVRITLDILALYVVVKFIRKPLRFFGAIGMPILATGLLYTSWLAISRLFLAVPLADRPSLILGVLLIVLGIQIIALGLIGEIIVFASGRRIKDYKVERLL